MKKRFIQFLFTAGAFLLMIGCGLIPQNPIEDESDPVPEGMTRVTVNLGGSKAPEASLLQWGSLTISGGGMETIKQDVSSGTVTLQVPAGPLREFVLSAQTGTVFYEGRTVTDLVPRTSVTVSIPMEVRSTRLFIPDQGNYRLVQIDDISGNNWIDSGAYFNGANYPFLTDFDYSGNIYTLILGGGGDAITLASTNTFLGESTVWTGMGVVDVRNIAIDRTAASIWLVTSELGTYGLVETTPALNLWEYNAGTEAWEISLTLPFDAYVTTVDSNADNIFYISSKFIDRDIIAVHYYYESNAGKNRSDILEIFDLSGSTLASLATYTNADFSGDLYALTSYLIDSPYGDSFSILKNGDALIVGGCGTWSGYPALRTIRYPLEYTDGAITGMTAPLTYSEAPLPDYTQTGISYSSATAYDDGTGIPVYFLKYSYGSVAAVNVDCVAKYDVPTPTSTPVTYGSTGTGTGQFDF